MTDIPPLIEDINVTPLIFEAGYENVSISANITDNVAVNASSVYTNMTYPNGSSTKLYMYYVSGDIFEIDFSDTWQRGNYTFWIYAEDTSSLSNDTSAYPKEFSINASAYMELKTHKDSYGPSQEVLLSPNYTQEINITYSGSTSPYHTISMPMLTSMK